jgi:hypothetical protein
MAIGSNRCFDEVRARAIGRWGDREIKEIREIAKSPNHPIILSRNPDRVKEPGERQGLI